MFRLCNTSFLSCGMEMCLNLARPVSVGKSQERHSVCGDVFGASFLRRLMCLCGSFTCPKSGLGCVRVPLCVCFLHALEQASRAFRVFCVRHVHAWRPLERFLVGFTMFAFFLLGGGTLVRFTVLAFFVLGSLATRASP